MPVLRWIRSTIQVVGLSHGIRILLCDGDFRQMRGKYLGFRISPVSYTHLDVYKRQEKVVVAMLTRNARNLSLQPVVPFR